MKLDTALIYEVTVSHIIDDQRFIFSKKFHLIFFSTSNQRLFTIKIAPTNTQITNSPILQHSCSRRFFIFALTYRQWFLCARSWFTSNLFLTSRLKNVAKAISSTKRNAGFCSNSVFLVLLQQFQSKRISPSSMFFILFLGWREGPATSVLCLRG